MVLSTPGGDNQDQALLSAFEHCGIPNEPEAVKRQVDTQHYVTLLMITNSAWLAEHRIAGRGKTIRNRARGKAKRQSAWGRCRRPL
jgi:hypothetical protein